MSLPVYLKLLGISFNASPQEIEKAYRKLAKKARSGRNDAEFLTEKLIKYKKPALLRIFDF
jgi:curved DNA-binding protein CbpA